MKNSGNLFQAVRYALMLFLISFSVHMNSINAGAIYIGTATADITPSIPVALTGQFRLRIAQEIETPLTANVVVLESREGQQILDFVIMVSCDLECIPNQLLTRVRDKVRVSLPDLDVSKIFLNGTHTHTGPVLVNGPDFYFRYAIPEEGVLQVEEYDRYFVEKVSGAIIEAWKNRNPGSVTWGFSHAISGYNRRTVYKDGSTVMYGSTGVPEFFGMEGRDGHDLHLLFFWNQDDELISIAINTDCPAQVVEERSTVNADYWYPVREQLKERFGPDLCVLTWIGAGGDLSPRPMYNKAAEERMMRLRGISLLEEIARRIVLAVDDTYEIVKEERYTDIPLVHRVDTLGLPMMKISQEDYEFSKAQYNNLSAQIEADPESAERLLARMTWFRDVVWRYEAQEKEPCRLKDAEIHVIRLGDVVICTNEFELFSDYGIRIKAGSDALQTFIIQLAGVGTYLPTSEAVRGGGYSAIVQSCLVGPEGGEILVNRTLSHIYTFFSNED